MPQDADLTPDGLLVTLRQLSDDELVARIKGLASRARRATALLVAHLAELDTRDCCLRAGYASLFTYCCEVLGLSEDEAYNRIEAARAARRFPNVLGLLASGEVSLTAVRLLGRHLTNENHLAVLESARGKRKAEVEQIVARLAPRPDVTASIRRLPELRRVPAAWGVLAPAKPVAPSDQSVTWGEIPPLVRAEAHVAGPAMVSPSGEMHTSSPSAHRPAGVEALSPDRYRYQLAIGGTTLEKLRLAKDMLRHALPSGGHEAILDRALTALLKELARKKFGAERKAGPTGNETGSPGKKSLSNRFGAADSRYLPVAIRRAVWVRDLGRCAFVAKDGRRCGERAFVEFHPSGRGGSAARPPSRTSSSAAVDTTSTRRACSSLEVAGRVWPRRMLRSGQCGRRALRTSFRNEDLVPERHSPARRLLGEAERLFVGDCCLQTEHSRRV